jgi:nucleoid-associated protein YgaU
MSRYRNTDFTKKKIEKDGKKKSHLSFKTTIYSKVPETDSDMYLIATEGDRCDILANQFYGNPELWWFIARVNHLKTMNIPAGTSLRIPSSTQSANGG